MKIKQLLFSLCILCSLSSQGKVTSPVAGPDGPVSIQQPMGKGAMPKPGTPEFDAMMSEQMASLDAFLSQQSPQEQEEIIKFLSELGQEIINEAAEKGYDDPFEYISKELSEQEEVEEEKPERGPFRLRDVPGEEGKAVIVAAWTVESVIKLLHNLTAVIASLRQKTINTPELSNKLIPFKYRLDDLIYFAQLFENETLTQYLTTKEFSTLVDQIEMLQTTLAGLDRRLEVPELSLERIEPHVVLKVPADAPLHIVDDAYHGLMAKHDPIRIRTQMAKEGARPDEIKEATQQAQKKIDVIEDAYSTLRHKHEANQIVDAMLDAIAKATEKDGIIDGFKNVLKQHEPKMLAERQEREKIEADARRQQESLLRQRFTGARREIVPPTGGPAWSGDRWRPEPSYGGGIASGGLPSDTGAGKTVGGSKAVAPKKPAGSGKKDEKKKDDKDKKDEKGKGKDTKAPAKGGKKEAAVDKDVERKLGIIEAKLSKIKESLKKNSNKFTDFIEFLTTNITPANKDDEQKKSKEYHDLFLDLSVDLYSIARSDVKKALTDFKDKKAKKDAYQAGTKELWNKFLEAKEVKTFVDKIVNNKLTGEETKFDSSENVGGMDRKVTKYPAPEKRFILFGATEGLGKDLTTEDNKWVLDLNKPDDEGMVENRIGNVKSSFFSAQEALQGTKGKAPEQKPAEEKKEKEKEDEPAGGEDVPDLPANGD